MSQLTDREILLRIYRRFSKDEAIIILKQKLADAEFKNGELISENAELRSGGGMKKHLWLQHEVMGQVNRQVKNLQKKNDMMQKQLNDYRDKYYSLKLKTDTP